MNQRTKDAINAALDAAEGVGSILMNDMAGTADVNEARADLAKARAELEAAIEEELSQAFQSMFRPF